MESRIESERIQTAVRLVCNEWRGVPRVVGCRVSVGDDSVGFPAVFVDVVLDESTRDEEWTSANLDRITEALRTAVTGVGSDRWVYTTFYRPSDLAEGAVA